MTCLHAFAYVRQQLEQANLPPTCNLWHVVFDFNDEAKTGKNWSIRSEAEVRECVYICIYNKQTIKVKVSLALGYVVHMMLHTSIFFLMMVFVMWLFYRVLCPSGIP